jgi:segregation and condensation protein A
MLLPRPVIDEEGNEIDPREELVKHLLEYKKYKSVVGELMTMEEENIGKEKRGNVIREIKKLAEVSNVEAELQDLDLYKLLKAFEKAIDTYIAESDQPAHTIVQFPYTIEDQKKYLLSELQVREKLSFVDIISSNPQKIAVIYNFLAILELLQSGLARISLGEGFNNFWLKAHGEKVNS